LGASAQTFTQVGGIDDILHTFIWSRDGSGKETASHFFKNLGKGAIETLAMLDKRSEKRAWLVHG
jgi:hypothetical protein